ncbi:hypothetical protein Tsubulata_046111 [Turnera subulata]|uniref:Uncharacterized protein n=1 Tax=Turnera subulata TaxID=218843 RepID=A0A9Q0FD92_9ROSI|nr:hypothetical protein Tsubulata_046111 [Turnera subulata]
MIKKVRFIRKCFYKCLTVSSKIVRFSTATSTRAQEYEQIRSSVKEDYYIPEDVPKGHLAVYVGEDCKRFVISIALLEHPLFKALLDRAEEVFGFDAGSKLCIPCNENMFMSILHGVKSQQDRRFFFCF